MEFETKDERVDPFTNQTPKKRGDWKASVTKAEIVDILSSFWNEKV